MKQIVRNTKIVSDGVVVEFADGVLAYFAADFLRRHVGHESNQMLLGYDPTPAEDRKTRCDLSVC